MRTRVALAVATLAAGYLIAASATINGTGADFSASTAAAAGVAAASIGPPTSATISLHDDEATVRWTMGLHSDSTIIQRAFVDEHASCGTASFVTIAQVAGTEYVDDLDDHNNGHGNEGLHLDGREDSPKEGRVCYRLIAAAGPWTSMQGNPVLGIDFD